MFIAKTPLRITLAGGGTDIESFSDLYGSDLISMAINKYIYIVCHSPISNEIILKYSKTEKVKNISKIKHKLIKQIFIDNNLKSKIEIASFADLESSSGLGSSGSFAVGLTNIVNRYLNNRFNKYELAKKAYISEKKVSNNLAGYQDTFISHYGGVKRFTSLPKSNSVKVSKLDINTDFLKLISKSFFIIDTGIRRSAAKILQKQVFKKNDPKKSNYMEILNLSTNIRKSILESNLKEFSYLNKIHWDLKIKKGSFMAHPTIINLIESLLIDCFDSCKLIGAGYGGYILGVSLNPLKSKNILNKLKLNYFQIEVSRGCQIFKI